MNSLDIFFLIPLLCIYLFKQTKLLASICEKIMRKSMQM